MTADDGSPLYEDIKAMDKVSKEVARLSSEEGPKSPSALERGQRVRPDGTRETYERVEYRD